MKRWEVLCDGCRETIHRSFYMLQDELWKSIAKPKDKYLCLACVEKRLGRKLKKDDFKSLPINYIYGHLPFEESPEEYKKTILGHWMTETDNHLKRLNKQRRPDPTTLDNIKSFSKWLDEEWEKLK